MELIYILQDAINYCDRLIDEMEIEKRMIDECMSGELMKEYLICTDEEIQELKHVKESLLKLQLEEKLKL